MARVQRELNLIISELHETKSEMQRLQDQKKRQSLPPSSNAAPTITSSILFQSDARFDENENHQAHIDSEISEPESTTETSSMSESQRQSNFGTVQQQKHSFIIRTFVAPLKCNHCTSIMIGLIRQGLVCEGKI